MSFDAIRHVLEAKLSTMDKMVSLCIANFIYQGETETNGGHIDSLEVISGMSKSSLYRSITSLIKEGAINRIDHGLKKPCEYSLNLDWFKARKISDLPKPRRPGRPSFPLLIGPAIIMSHTETYSTVGEDNRNHLPHRQMIGGKSSPTQQLVSIGESPSPTQRDDSPQNTPPPPNAPARVNSQVIPRKYKENDLRAIPPVILATPVIAPDPPMPVLSQGVVAADREPLVLGSRDPSTAGIPRVNPLPAPQDSGDSARQSPASQHTDRACDQIRNQSASVIEPAKIASQLALVASGMPDPSLPTQTPQNAPQEITQAPRTKFPAAGPGSIPHKVGLIYAAAKGLLIIQGSKHYPPIENLPLVPDAASQSEFLNRITDSNPSDDELREIGQMIVDKKAFPFKGTTQNTFAFKVLIGPRIWPGVIGEARAIVAKRRSLPPVIPSPKRPRNAQGIELSDLEISTAFFIDKLDRAEWPEWSAKFPPVPKRKPKTGPSHE